MQTMEERVTALELEWHTFKASEAGNVTCDPPQALLTVVDETIRRLETFRKLHQREIEGDDADDYRRVVGTLPALKKAAEEFRGMGN